MLTDMEKHKIVNNNNKKVARARNQYTDYIVREPMELMQFLAARMPQASRTKLKSLLSKRIVYVDQKITTQYNYPLQQGMKVQISRTKSNHEFRNRLLKLVYEDAYLMVVEKETGLLSVNTEREKERTAATILTEYLRRSNKRSQVYVVHRLDRDTSGLMMFAKDEQTQHTLRDNWHQIVFDRRYVAIVHGNVEQDYGTVRSWLTDKKLYVASRKNQIRVHMADLGHPVIGDGRYGLEDDDNPLNRLGLHAFKLCFTHPVTGEKMQFETPYPISFKRLMQRPVASAHSMLEEQ